MMYTMLIVYLPNYISLNAFDFFYGSRGAETAGRPASTFA